MNREQFLEFCGRLFDSGAQVDEGLRRNFEIGQRWVEGRLSVIEQIGANTWRPTAEGFSTIEMGAYDRARERWRLENLTCEEMDFQERHAVAEAGLCQSASEVAALLPKTAVYALARTEEFSRLQAAE